MDVPKSVEWMVKARYGPRLKYIVASVKEADVYYIVLHKDDTTYDVMKFRIVMPRMSYQGLTENYATRDEAVARADALTVS